MPWPRNGVRRMSSSAADPAITGGQEVNNRANNFGPGQRGVDRVVGIGDLLPHTKDPTAGQFCTGPHGPPGINVKTRQHLDEVQGTVRRCSCLPRSGTLQHGLCTRRRVGTLGSRWPGNVGRVPSGSQLLVPAHVSTANDAACLLASCERCTIGPDERRAVETSKNGRGRS